MTPEERQEQRDLYYASRGCMCTMFKLAISFILLLITTTLIAQPIKPQFEMGIRSYKPPVYINTNTNAPVPGPRGPRGYDGKSQIVHVIDTSKSIPDMSQYMRKDDFQDIMARNITNVYNQQEDISVVVRQIDEYYEDKMKILEYSLHAHQLKNAGTFKILSGIGLQAVALGLVAYADVDIVTEANTYMDYPIGYSIKEYSLTETPIKIPNKCVTSHTIYRYELTSKTTDKVTGVVINDRFTYVMERNKTAYYTAAGILGGTGVVLEVLGIIDLHNAHVLINHNSMGVKLTF